MPIATNTPNVWIRNGPMGIVGNVRYGMAASDVMAFDDTDLSRAYRGGGRPKDPHVRTPSTLTHPPDGIGAWLRSEEVAMKVLVVYESLYGSTAAVAGGIAETLHELGIEAQARPVTHIDPVESEGSDLLIVGGPTHAHGMSRANTRLAGAKDEKNTYPEPTVGAGLRDWLDEIPRGNGRPAAAFDTRFDKPAIITGSAAKGFAKKLTHHGFRLVAEPESFFVTAAGLEEGEMEHAAAWARSLAGMVERRLAG